MAPDTLPQRTASGIAWALRLADDRPAYAIAQTLGIPELIARILAGRGVAVDDAYDVLNPSLRRTLPDPSHLLDMDASIARVQRAIEQGERIAVFGDYDVDGATSSALLVRYFRALGMELIRYIPDRMKEGYGPNITAFDSLIDAGVTLIITVDCGTLAFEPIAHAQARACDVVVLDHHTAEAALPEALVVNPNRLDESSPHRTLAAVGVTFLFLVGLNRALREHGFFEAAKHSVAKEEPQSPDLLAMLDIVALGTVADVVPLKGLNRVLVAQGLKLLRQSPQLGLRALMQVAQLHEVASAYHLGFVLGPRINAGGRVGESALGLELLTCEDEARATALATQLDAYNRERQAIEASVLAEAMQQAEAQANMPVMLLAAEGWHAGVIGIVAARVKEQWQRPVAVVALDKGMGKGSARSVEGADIGAAIHRAVAAGVIVAGGGHAMAAGFSLRAEQCQPLQLLLVELLQHAVAGYAATRRLLLDGWLSCAGATPDMVALMEQAGPYGAGNPSPRFGLRDVKVLRRDWMKDKHMRLVLCDATGAGRLQAVAFNARGSALGDMLCAPSPRLSLAGSLRLNRWGGRESVQLMIDDAACE